MKKLVTILTLFVAASAIAENVYDDQYQTIKSIDTYEIIENESGEEVKVLLTSKAVSSPLERTLGITTLKSGDDEVKIDGDKVSEVLEVTREFVALGKDVYEIVKGGEAIVNLETSPVQILPRNKEGVAVHSINLTDWQLPTVRKYKIEVKNYMKKTTVSMEYMVIFSYGGKYEGKGSYITGAEIKPIKVIAKWGNKFDAAFKLQSVLNQGSAEEPIAGAVLMLDYRVRTIFSDESTTVTYFINGLGQVTSY